MNYEQEIKGRDVATQKQTALSSVLENTLIEINEFSDEKKVDFVGELRAMLIRHFETRINNIEEQVSEMNAVKNGIEQELKRIQGI